MSSKKKNHTGKRAAKPAVKRIATQKPVASKRTETARIRKSVASESGATTVPQPIHRPNQLTAFETAMKLFHAQKFHEAREHFRAAINGLDGAIAHSAELHIRMCERRLSAPAESSP